MDKKCIVRDFKNIIFLTLVIGFSFVGSLKAFASDNVLQAVQIDGVKDSYNIVLRSDDTADLKKTIQAPNKMILTLKGIRASKSINTIYNNTANLDSVVVEPMGDNEVKILIQADNIDQAEVKFDTLKTPLGVLNTPSQPNENDKLVLSKPMEAYTPVYDNSLDEQDNSGLSDFLTNPITLKVKKALKNEKVSWMITLGLFSIMVMSGIKAIRGKDSEISVGLSQSLNAQSLKERELNLYRANAAAQLQNNMHSGYTSPSLDQVADINPMSAGTNYGLKAYQNGVKNPYVSSEIQRPRPSVSPAPSIQRPKQPINVPDRNQMAAQIATQMATQKLAQKTSPNFSSNTATNTTRPRTTNIDSMKFLESMTKIYEKNGRTDLAQGLKTNMIKAKSNMV